MIFNAFGFQHTRILKGENDWTWRISLLFTYLGRFWVIIRAITMDSTMQEEAQGSREAFFKSYMYVCTSKLVTTNNYWAWESSLSFCKRSIKMWNWSSVGFLLFKILINMICLKNQLGEEAAVAHKVQNEEAEPVSRPDTWQLIIIQEKKDCHW